MRLFVTGGAGFIGSNFIRHVLDTQPNVEVVNFDLLTYAGNLASLTDVAERHSRRYGFVRGDIRDATAVADAMRGCDAVVHFAAESHVDRSIDGAGEFLSTNILGAQTVFDAAMHLEVGNVLHISTDEVYGSIDEGHWDEAWPLEPNSPYATSKAAADLLARAYRVTYGFPIKVTRTANNVGPYQHVEKMLPKSITNLIDGEPITLYGDGLNVRDWTFVGDNVEAQWKVLVDGTPGEVYNVGAGNERPNVDVVAALLDQFGVGDEMVTRVADRPGHDARYSVDTAKVRRELDWAPSHDFEETIAATVAWYRANEAWWRPLKDAGATARLGLAKLASA